MRRGLIGSIIVTLIFTTAILCAGIYLGESYIIKSYDELILDCSSGRFTF